MQSLTFNVTNSSAGSLIVNQHTDRVGGTLATVCFTIHAANSFCRRFTFILNTTSNLMYQFKALYNCILFTYFSYYDYHLLTTSQNHLYSNSLSRIRTRKSKKVAFDARHFSHLVFIVLQTGWERF